MILYTTPARQVMNIAIDPKNHILGFKNIGLPKINTPAPIASPPNNTPMTVKASYVVALYCTDLPVRLLINSKNLWEVTIPSVYEIPHFISLKYLSLSS